MGLHLDITLTIQTQRRISSSMPAHEELRNKFRVMSYMLVAQMRQPTKLRRPQRVYFHHPRRVTQRKKFLARARDCRFKMIVPNWTHCLEYEFQRRKDALRLAREEGQSIEKALWAA